MSSNKLIIALLPAEELGYDATLSATRAALRREAWAEAEVLLMRAGPLGTSDPAFNNLLGVLWEVRGNEKAARRCYGRAIRADAHYAPAQQNMRRLFELTAFGRSSEAVALGDEA